MLCYHSISDASSNTVVSKNTFEHHIALLKKSGAPIVPLSDIVAWARGEKTLPRKAVALTFDDGYVDFKTDVVPLLERYQIPAAVFIIGDPEAARQYLGNNIPTLSNEDISALRAHRLVEVGYHSTTHANLARLTQNALTAEVASPFPVRFFAYPGGNHSPEVAEALQKAGYEAACTIGRDLVSRAPDPYHIPRTVIMRDSELWQVRFATTRASHWFRTVGRLFK